MRSSDQNGPVRLPRALRILAAATLVATVASVASADPKVPDNLTFRPTVVLRQGPSQGSGTVIASRDNDTLILTAAHVVEKSDQVTVEIHRYNMGVESIRSSEGWPRRVSAKVVARDPGADVAIIRVQGMKALPFVARVAFDREEPIKGTEVVSVGIDKGADLNSWSSQVRGLVYLDMDRGGGDRPFLITNLPPEHGRSGGGLFRSADASVIGVCVGRVQVSEGRRVGVFASTASIRRLLRSSGLEETVAISRARNSRRVPPPPIAVERTTKQSN